MSERRVVESIRAACQDPDTGLVAHVAAITSADAIAADVVSTDFNFERWLRSGNMQTATTTNIAITPTRLASTLKLPHESQRDETIEIEVATEVFHSEPDVIETSLTVLGLALRRVLDTLVEYSQAHDPVECRIVQVVEPITIEYGEFTGNTAGVGFRTLFSVMARGTQ